MFAQWPRVRTCARAPLRLKELDVTTHALLLTVEEFLARCCRRTATACLAKRSEIRMCGFASHTAPTSHHRKPVPYADLTSPNKLSNTRNAAVPLSLGLCLIAPWDPHMDLSVRERLHQLLSLSCPHAALLTALHPRWGQCHLIISQFNMGKSLSTLTVC